MGVQNSQKFQAGTKLVYRYPVYCGSLVQNSQKFRSGIHTLYWYPGYCETGRTEHTEVPGTGMKVVKNSQKCRVRV